MWCAHSASLFTYGMGGLDNTIVLILCDTEIGVLNILYMYSILYIEDWDLDRCNCVDTFWNWKGAYKNLLLQYVF